MTVRKLQIDELPTKKPPRNKAELSLTNGFEFGLGFWVAGMLVMFFGVPALTCVTFIALAAIGRN